MNNEIKFGDGIYISKGKDAKQFTDEGKVIIFPENNSDNLQNSSSNTNKDYINYRDSCDTTNPNEFTKKPSYIYKNTAELIQILECEFIEFQEEICLLKKANEDMLEFDPHDYDLIQAREDNLKIINKRLGQLRDLQNRLKEFCPTHPFVLKDVWEIISLIENNSENPDQVLYQILNEKDKKIEENKDNKTEENQKYISNLNEEITGNVQFINNSQNLNERIGEKSKQEIIKEIDL